MLREERRNDIRRVDGLGMPREKRPVADVPPATDHHRVDREQVLLVHRRDDVDVTGRGASTN